MAAATEPARNPVTGWPLKPGQRLPTWGEAIEAHETFYESRHTHFPLSRRWEISWENAVAWVRHGFEPRRGAAALGALVNDEFGLLLSDLDCYRDLYRRGVAPCDPVSYLLPGREHWGVFGILARLYVALQHEEVDLSEFGLQDASPDDLALFWAEEERLRALERAA